MRPVIATREGAREAGRLPPGTAGSPIPGLGSTTVAVNLATALQKASRQPTLVMDLHLAHGDRDQAIHHLTQAIHGYQQVGAATDMARSRKAPAE